MSSYTPKPGTGVLFKSDRKRTSRDPDMTGSIVRGDGREYWISAWWNEPRGGGEQYLRITVGRMKEARDAMHERQGRPGHPHERQGMTNAYPIQAADRQPQSDPSQFQVSNPNWRPPPGGTGGYEPPFAPHDSAPNDDIPF